MQRSERCEGTDIYVAFGGHCEERALDGDELGWMIKKLGTKSLEYERVEKSNQIGLD